MPFQAYNHMTIAKRNIKNIKAKDVTVGYEFQMQYPSYRGTFLSCIENLEIEVDGEALKNADTVFILNGKQFLISELKDCFKEYWFVLDFATVRVTKIGVLSPGKHTVHVKMRHRIPYTGYFGDYMIQEADETRILDVEEEG